MNSTFSDVVASLVKGGTHNISHSPGGRGGRGPGGHFGFRSGSVASECGVARTV